MTRQAVMATAAVIVGILAILVIVKWVFYPGSKMPDLASQQNAPRPQPEEPVTSPEISQDQEQSASAARPESAKLGAKSLRSKPQTSSRAQSQAKGPGKSFSPRPAEPGIYQTIRRTSVRTRPNNSASVVDEIDFGARLNVLGSAGDWLIVRSNKLKTVVYVKRDDAMFLPGEKPVTESFSEAEARWKKVESEIYKAFSRWGVKGVSVSFIADTAYLIGDVKTEDERFRAEQAVRTIPEVERIYNGVWVTP